MRSNHKTESGFIILSATIILGAVGTAIGLTLAYLAINSAENSTTSQQSSQARYLTDACAEFALDEIRLDENYAGEEEITIDDQTCSIGTVNKNGAEYIIPNSATVGAATRRLEVIADRTVTPDPLDPLAPGTVAMTIDSWQEIADF